jgi:hypothetical protein
MEILRALAIGAIAGAIYIWPFVASKSYKPLVLSGVRQGRAVALLKNHFIDSRPYSIAWLYHFCPRVF